MGQSSGGRKFIGVIGIAMVGLGFLVFLSAMFSGVSNFGDFTNFESRTRSMGKRAVIGMGIFAFGGFLAAIGGGRRRGQVNAHYQAYDDNTGRDYDPRAARHLTRPNDPAYDGYKPEAPPPERIVKIRCRSCSSLNDEKWNYCNSCGAPL